MNRYYLLSLGWCLLSAVASAYPSLTLKVSRIDGLPARLIQAGDIKRDITLDARSIDLAPAMRAMGCAIEPGETIMYSTSSGALLRNLSEENHRIVDEIIDNLYRLDNLIVSFRTYIDLLEPLPNEERLVVVRQVGFLPDHLVSSMIAELRLVSGADENNKLSPAEARAVRELEKATLDVIQIALDRMKKQLAVIVPLRTEPPR